MPEDIKNNFNKPAAEALQKHYRNLTGQDSIPRARNDDPLTVERRTEYLNLIKEHVRYIYTVPQSSN